MASSLDHQAFGQTRAEWLSNLNTEYKPPREFRRTSIICTIGMFQTTFMAKQTDKTLISSLARSQDQLP